MNTALRRLADVLGVAQEVQLERLGVLLEGGVMEMIDVQAGDVLWRGGERAEENIMCLSGLLKVISPGAAGRVCRLVLPGELAGASYLIPGGRHFGNLVAANTSKVLRFTQETLRSWFDYGPDVAMSTMRHQCMMMDRMQRQLCALTEGTVAARLARLLLLLASRTPRFEREGLRLNLTQAELASLIGARRETVARQISQWKKAKVLQIERGGPWRFQADALEAEANGPELDWSALKRGLGIEGAA